MEVIVLLKFEVDSEQLKKSGDTDDNLKAKIRAWIADVVGHYVQEQDGVKLESSALAKDDPSTKTVQIQPSNQVMKLPPDMKVQ